MRSPSGLAPPAGPAAARAEPPARQAALLMAAAVAGTAGLAAFQLPLPGVRPGRINGLGLISVLPVSCLIGLGLLIVAFTLLLGLPRARPVALGAVLAATVICLDGVTARAEPQPRFPTTYQIAGYIDYISRTGHTAPALDAYFSWPGFFALIAMAAGAAGAHNLTEIMRWWPAAVDLLCLLPLFLITRSLRASWQARWYAALLLSLGNWVGQDYFSPQSLNFLLYLIFVAILLNWFGRAQPRSPCSGEREPLPAAGRQQVVLLLVLIAIFATSVVSHQLTPFLMLAACAGLVLARRCRLTGLPVLLGVILAGWISFGTVAFWSGHLQQMFGPVGHLLANFSSGVGGRVAGHQLHALVPQARIGAAAVVLAMAVAGVARRLRGGVRDVAALVLLGVPFLAPAVQNYGGEIVLRTYLFALPAACILGSYLFFPAGSAPRRAWLPVTAAGLAGLVLAGLFLVARYGNEAFEQTPPGELTAMNYLYARDSGGIRLIWLSQLPLANATPQMPWQYRDFEKVNYITAAAPADPASVRGLAAQLRQAGPASYLITTSTQEAYLEQVAGYPAGWGRRFRAAMAAAPGVRVAFADTGAVVYTMSWPPGSPRQPMPPVAVREPARGAGWTLAGMIALWLLLLALTAREVISLGVPAARWLLRPLTAVSVPLLVVLLAAIAMRFVLLS
ncbi:MAG: hypothetical protein ACLQK8_00755 [Streptosporangiaceae bacterium]